MTTPHKYADILRAIADGKEIEWQLMNEWKKVETSEFFFALQNKESKAHFRIAPETVNINGHKIEVVTAAPPKGTDYWVPNVCNQDFFAAQQIWCNDICDLRWLDRGLVHLTPEAAAAHSKALVSFTAKESV